MTTEILSPAGNQSMLASALKAGCDAVYLGLTDFSARKRAGNFTADEFISAVKLCHGKNRKVYLALNTLITDRELGSLYSAAELACENGIDGIIVQDFAAAKAVKRIGGGKVPLHASTQMSVANAAGVNFLEREGFSRVVLARELSVSDINKIAADTNLELEVFVYGSSCVSVSGQCGLSAVMGGRSGNRGDCACPCRLDFSAAGRHFVLSRPDMSLLKSLANGELSGIASLKIEGRMRGADYVREATLAVKQALAGKIAANPPVVRR